jgi:curli biogenesis system outer membrane secretion channel CsgG
MNGIILFLLLAAQSPVPQKPAEPAVQAPATQSQAAQQSEPAPNVDKAKSLSKVRRIFVESFGTDPISQQMQGMVISSLTDSKRFIVTEDKSKADAILKGVATEKASQEVHAYGKGTAVGTASGGSHASVFGSGGTFSGSAGSGYGAVQSATQDSSLNTESIDNAHAAVRLVNSDGDVIWTSIQESNGAKFKGASADVADKIAKQLARDAEKADSLISVQTTSK